MNNLIESYYSVAKDLAFKADEMKKAADVLYAMADEMSQQMAKVVAAANAHLSGTASGDQK